MYVVNYQDQLEQLRSDLSNEKENGADAARIAELEGQIDELKLKIRKENNSQDALEALDSLVIPAGDVQYTLRDIITDETSYQIGTAFIKQLMVSREDVLIDEVYEGQKQAKEKESSLKAEKESLQTQYDALYEELSALRLELAAEKEAKADAEKKRDAAATELEAANTEIKRLEDQVNDLRTEIAIGAKNAVRVIDVPDMNEMMERFKEQKKKEEESRPAIYNVNPLDNRNSRFSAQYAETDEYFEDYYMYIGKYRRVTAEEAPTFRAAYEEKRRNEDLARTRAELEASLTPPSLQFQETDGTEHGLDQGNIDGEMEGQDAPTVEERLAALEQRVSALEKSRQGEAA